MIRSHEAGTLRKEHAGQQVTLAGWVARRRDHGGVTFIDLRDASGTAQVVFREEDTAHDLRSEFCVRITGEVRVRFRFRDGRFSEWRQLRRGAPPPGTSA